MFRKATDVVNLKEYKLRSVYCIFVAEICKISIYRYVTIVVGVWERTIQPFRVEFVENKVNIGQGFLRQLQYSLVSSVPQLFQIFFFRPPAMLWF